MAGLINEKVSESLNELVRLCFESNAILDRIVNIFNCKYNMPQTSNILHQRLAHVYPTLFADKLTDYGLLRNDDSKYGNIPIINKDYNNILDAFNDIVGVQMKIEEQVKKTIDIANENKDYSTRIFIENFYIDTVILYTKQSLMLKKAVDDYENKDLLPLLDNNIENYIIIPAL